MCCEISCQLIQYHILLIIFLSNFNFISRKHLLPRCPSLSFSQPPLPTKASRRSATSRYQLGHRLDRQYRRSLVRPTKHGRSENPKNKTTSNQQESPASTGNNKPRHSASANSTQTAMLALLISLLSIFQLALSRCSWGWKFPQCQ